MLYAYTYIVLLIGSFASYGGAHVTLVFVVATLLALPNITRDRDGRLLTVQVVASTVNALIFAIAAYAIGRTFSYLLAA